MALQKLHADPELRRRLGRAGRRRVLAEFDVQVSAGEMARRFGVVRAA
jgi:glycosyltransferase involved in cell wall biosynthesis